jgi:hypothetical protein
VQQVLLRLEASIENAVYKRHIRRRGLQWKLFGVASAKRHVDPEHGRGLMGAPEHGAAEVNADHPPACSCSPGCDQVVEPSSLPLGPRLGTLQSGGSR